MNLINDVQIGYWLKLLKEIYEAEMKTIIIAMFTVLLSTSIALAAWQDTFLKDFAENGTAAVTNALALGASPAEIIDVAKAAGIQAETLVTAMCDSGLSPQDLQGFQTGLAMTINDIMTACGQGNISYENQFPGATKDSTSVNKQTNYAGDGKPLAPRPASPNNFNQ